MSSSDSFHTRGCAPQVPKPWYEKPADRVVALDDRRLYCDQKATLVRDFSAAGASAAIGGVTVFIVRCTIYRECAFCYT